MRSVRRRRCCVTVGTARLGSQFLRGRSRRPAAADFGEEPLAMLRHLPDRGARRDFIDSLHNASYLGRGPMRKHFLALLAYVVATLATQAVSHFGVNAAHYAAGTYLRAQPIFALGVLSMLIQGSIMSYLRSEEHTSELQSRLHLVCRLLLEKKKRY